MSHSSVTELKTKLQALTREIQGNLTHAQRRRETSTRSNEVIKEVLNRNNASEQAQALSSLLQRQDARLDKVEQDLLTVTEQVLSSPDCNSTSRSSRGSSRQISSLCATQQLVERFRSMYKDQGQRMQRSQIDDAELNDAPFDKWEESNEMTLRATALENSQYPPHDLNVLFQHRQSFFDEFHRQLEAVVETDHETDSSTTTTTTRTTTPASSSFRQHLTSANTATPGSWNTAAAESCSTPGSLATPPTPNLSLNTTRILSSLPKQQQSLSSSERPLNASSLHYYKSSPSASSPSSSSSQLVSDNNRMRKAINDENSLPLLMQDVSLMERKEDTVQTVIHQKQNNTVGTTTQEDDNNNGEHNGSGSLCGSDDDDISLNRDDTYDEEDVTVATEPTIVNPHRHHFFLGSSRVHLQNHANNDDTQVEGDEDEDAEDDEDDSAAYCPTIRQDRPFAQKHGMLVKSTQVTSMDSPPRQRKERPSHIEVDMEMPSPTPTNITMDTVLEDQVLLNAIDFSNRPKPDTSVLDRYRLDRDDDSPLGVKVVPIPNDFASPPPPPFSQVLVQHKAKEHTPSPSSKSPSTPCRTSTAPPQSNKRVFRKTPHPSKSKILPPTIDENEPLDLAASFSPDCRGGFSLSLQSSSNNVNRIHLVESPSANDKKLSANQRICIPSLQSASENTHDNDVGVRSNGSGSCQPLCPVDLHEYKEAPRIFQMQVSHDELNNAIAVLQNDYSSASKCVWTRAQLHQRFAPFGFSQLKEKSVLMSLCHFQRLIMQRQDDDNVLFCVPSM